MAEKRDYYEVLGVAKDASAEEIKKAYRKITKENHPDLHPGDKACEERFKEANEAYEVLSDEEKRKKYDQFGHAAFDPNAGFNGGGFGDFGGFEDIFGGGFGGGFGDIFSSFFGGGGAARANPNAPRRGDNVRAQVNISFEEAAFGCEKEITTQRIEQCPDCKGTGCAPGTTAEICPDCKGSGQVRTTQRTPFGLTQTMGVCSKCRGTGKIIHQPCKTCRGLGSIRRQHKMTVKIPAGIDDGQSISRAGYGNAGVNGGPAGDLLISVIVRPHAIFEREGTNIYMEQEISFTQAALGAELELPTLDGKVKYTIPEGTQPGTTFRLRGKGVPYLRSPGTRGDQFVTVKVGVPKGLNANQKELLRQYAASMGETDSSKGGIFGKKKK
ncbi:MAG: molecular chaperone DnaJ [Oscillospiraceae bacterium]|nr:molecular chaperone DnaJ [Oscillospiraceae bacterium]